MIKMPYNVIISNLNNNTSWEKQLTAQEFPSVKSLVRGFGTVGILSATLKPVRTNNFQNFAKDFFLPTLVNHAIKVENIIGKIFAILGALILDTLTFPIRIVTFIPRVISNGCQEQDLLKKYLINKGVDPKLLDSDHVRVRLEWEKTTPYSQTAGKIQHSMHCLEQHWSEQNVNFIEVPTYSGYDHLVIDKEKLYDVDPLVFK
jgi:hypothetical protein